MEHGLLAEWAPLVGLEAVAEAAVVVLVGAQRVDDAVGRCALEDRGEEALFEDASLPADEVAGVPMGLCAAVGVPPPPQATATKSDRTATPNTRTA